MFNVNVLILDMKIILLDNRCNFGFLNWGYNFEYCIDFCFFFINSNILFRI